MMWLQLKQIHLYPASFRTNFFHFEIRFLLRTFLILSCTWNWLLRWNRTGISLWIQRRQLCESVTCLRFVNLVEIWFRVKFRQGHRYFSWVFASSGFYSVGLSCFSRSIRLRNNSMFFLFSISWRCHLRLQCKFRLGNAAWARMTMT